MLHPAIGLDYVPWCFTTRAIYEALGAALRGFL